MGRVRRCDRRCHTAKGTRCQCWCEGFFHGLTGAANRVKRKMVHIFYVRTEVKLVDIQKLGRVPLEKVLLPAIEEEEAPEDLFPPETPAEVEAVRYEPPPEPDEEAPPPEPPDEKTPDDVVAEDVPDLNALFRICFHFWQMQPNEVCRQLGYKNQMDAHSAGMNPWEAFLTIKRLKQEKKDHGAKEGC